MDQQTLTLLQNMPIFGGVSEEVLEYLLSVAKQYDVAHNTYLFREGEQGSSMFVIVEGRVSMIKHLDDADYTLGLLKVGDCVGEMSLIDMGPRSASVLAITKLKVLEITTTHFYKLHKMFLQQYTLIQMNISREICRRLRKTDRRLFELQVQADIPEDSYWLHLT